MGVCIPNLDKSNKEKYVRDTCAVDTTMQILEIQEWDNGNTILGGGHLSHPPPKVFFVNKQTDLLFDGEVFIPNRGMPHKKIRYIAVTLHFFACLHFIYMQETCECKFSLYCSLICIVYRVF